LRLLFELIENIYKRISATDLQAVKATLKDIFEDLWPGNGKGNGQAQTPVKLLLEHDLLPADCFRELQSLRNYATLGDWVETDIHIFLYEVCESAESFKGPVQCFNALKARESMSDVMRTKD